MAINEEQVKHVAKLAKLSFSDDELTGFTDQLGKIIDMVEQLGEVDNRRCAIYFQCIRDDQRYA